MPTLKTPSRVKRPKTFQEFLKAKGLKYPGVHNWNDLRKAVRPQGDEAIVQAREVWRRYKTAIKKK